MKALVPLLAFLAPVSSQDKPKTRTFFESLLRQRG